MAVDRRYSLLKHNHDDIYPRADQDETITGEWTFATDVNFLDDVNLTLGTGEDWDIRVTSGDALIIDDTTSGQLLVIREQGANKFVVNHASNLIDIQDGYSLRIRDAGDTDYGEFYHDGTDFNAAFTNTTDWNITGITELNWTGAIIDGGASSVTIKATPTINLILEGSVRMAEKAAAGNDLAGYGQIWVKNDTPNTLWFTDDAGTDHQIAFV